MGSMGSPSNSNWPPYNSYRDCSQGICSVYCPQWCYLIFPPPPSFQSGDDDSGMNFSPLIIVVIGILAGAFLLISYYTLISKYCKRSRNRVNAPVEFENRNHSTTHAQLQHATTGLDESLIKSIAVCKYKKGDEVVEGSECAVCISEFQEGESLRLLPKCNHAFHLQCIDTWLRSHSNCPLCRSHVMPGIPVPFQRPLESQITSSNFHVSSLVFQGRNDSVLVAEEIQQDAHRNEVVVHVVINDIFPKYPSHELECNAEEMRIAMNMEIGNDQEVQGYRRSTSLGAMPSQYQNLLIADILNIEEDYEDHVNHNQNQVGTSKGQNSRLAKRSNTMERSFSTGRFVFTRHDKGKNSILPN